MELSRQEWSRGLTFTALADHATAGLSALQHPDSFSADFSKPESGGKECHMDQDGQSGNQGGPIVL